MQIKPRSTPQPPNRTPIDTYLDAAGRVVAGVVCDGCRYDLRGQPGAGRCPECGEAIEPMLRAMVQEDARRPGYLLGLLSSIVASALFVFIAYLIERGSSNFTPVRIDSFDMFSIAMTMSLCYAIVSVGVAVLGETLEQPMLTGWGVMSAFGGVLFTLVFFALTHLVALA